MPTFCSMKQRRDSIFVRRSCPTRRATSNRNCKDEIELDFDISVDKSNDDLQRTTHVWFIQWFIIKITDHRRSDEMSLANGLVKIELNERWLHFVLMIDIEFVVDESDFCLKNILVEVSIVAAVHHSNCSTKRRRQASIESMRMDPFSCYSSLFHRNPTSQK